MNIYNNLILIKDEDKTQSIVSCNYINGKYEVIFNTSSKVYSYSYLSVRWIRNPQNIDTKSIKISHDGKALFDIKMILQFEDYYRVIFGNGKISLYNIRDLEIEKNSLHNKVICNCFEYFKCITDLLYSDYTEQRHKYLKKHKKISEYDSENLMYGLIKDILNKNCFKKLDVIVHQPLNMLIHNPKKLSDIECKYAMNCATHLDFLIFNKLDKLPVLAIEVDGYQFHKEGTVQADRDKLKNEILKKYNIPLLRLNTNGSQENEIIESKLFQLLGI